MKQKARILVVNPARQERQIYSTHLQKQGYDVVQAVSQVEANLLVETGLPDLILISADTRAWTAAPCANSSRPTRAFSMCR
jgi:CheY-like chemotaxis protein